MKSCDLGEDGQINTLADLKNRKFNFLSVKQCRLRKSDKDGNLGSVRADSRALSVKKSSLNFRNYL